MVNKSSRSSLDPHTVAVVSGKGGSGKTMIAAALAQALSESGVRVLLVDADLGTGGLTYYLGFSAFERTRRGLTEYLIAKQASQPLHFGVPRPEILKKKPYLDKMSFLPVGEHRIVARHTDWITKSAITRVITKTRGKFDVVIFDCRGGLDDDSIATCSAVKDVILVVETDAASIQATQYLTDQLRHLGVSNKIAGFVLNKVMDDPSSLATASTSFFGAQHLGSIPFDIETTRKFIKGELPDSESLFFRNTAAALMPLFSEGEAGTKYRPLKPSEFNNISISNPEGGIGGLLIGITSFYAIAAYLFVRFVADVTFTDFYHNIAFGGMVSLLAASLSDPFRQFLGRMMRGYAAVLGASVMRKR